MCSAIIIGANGRGKLNLFKPMPHITQEATENYRADRDYVSDSDNRLRTIERAIEDAQSSDNHLALSQACADFETADGHTANNRSEQLLHSLGFKQTDMPGQLQIFLRAGASVSILHMESTYFNIPGDDEDSLLHLQGASVSYRIAVGPQQGQKVFTLQTLPASTEGEYGQLANTSGFSLHAGVFANADEPDKLERLCRYISRPVISEQRLSMTQHGKVRYELKTPYRDGTTHVFFEPIDFIGKLAALIPPPRLNLTRQITC